MALLQTLGKGQGHLKAGFLGFQGSGKTMTATLLAIGTRRHFGLDGPIAFFDTEGGSEYVAQLIQQFTGQELLGVRSRAFDDLMKTSLECLEAKVSVLIVDSVTHVWRETCDAYLKQVNDRIRERNARVPADRRRGFKTSLEFQDWNPLKAIWQRWADWFLNAPLHVIICGRAGNVYHMEKDEESGKKELQVVGVKMKVEGEFGYEPSLLVEMDRLEIPDPHRQGRFLTRRVAVVKKDRFSILDGADLEIDSAPLREALQAKTPEQATAAMAVALAQTMDFFTPHLARLTPGAHATVDTTIKTDAGVDEDGDSAYARERRQRVIACEEIQGDLVAAYPGQTAEEKRAKTDLVFLGFRTRSWTKVETEFTGAELRASRRKIQEELVRRGKLDAAVLAPALRIPPTDEAPSVDASGQAVLIVEAVAPSPSTGPDIEITAELLGNWEDALITAPDQTSLATRWAILQTSAAFKLAGAEVQGTLMAIRERRLVEMAGAA